MNITGREGNVLMLIQMLWNLNKWYANKKGGARKREEELKRKHEKELKRKHEKELKWIHEEELRRKHEEELKRRHEEELKRKHEEEVYRKMSWLIRSLFMFDWRQNTSLKISALVKLLKDPWWSDSW